FVTHAMSTDIVAPLVGAPVMRTDYFAAALAEVRESNSLVETLYRIDRDGGFDIFAKPVPKEGADFAASRLAAGAAMLRDLWWSTWKVSEKPPRRRQTEEEFSASTARRCFPASPPRSAP